MPPVGDLVAAEVGHGANKLAFHGTQTASIHGQQIFPACFADDLRLLDVRPEIFQKQRFFLLHRCLEDPRVLSNFTKWTRCKIFPHVPLLDKSIDVGKREMPAVLEARPSQDVVQVFFCEDQSKEISSKRYAPAAPIRCPPRCILARLS